MKRKSVFAMLLVFAAYAPRARGMTLVEYELGWARYYARQDRVPFGLVVAVIAVESDGNPYAVSPKGAAGLMQLMPETADDFGVKNRFLIQENIRGGVAYLVSLIRRFNGDLRLAVAAYYAGEKLIEREGLVCSSPQIYNYVSRVAGVYRRLQAGWR